MIRLLTASLLGVLLALTPMPAQTEPASRDANSAAHAGARPPITGVAFLRVYTSDPAASAQLYGHYMGYHALPADGMQVYPVGHHQWLEVIPHAPPASAANPNDMLAAVGFRTSNAAALARFFEAHNIPLEQPRHPGEVSVRDPEGNLVVFVQTAGPNPAPIATRVAAQPLSPEAPAHRIIHVGFIVHDRAKEDAFWRDILGFRPYWHGTMHPPNTDWISLQVPDGTDWLEYMMMPNQSPDKHGFGMSNHVSLGVDRMQTVLHDLQQNGCDAKMCTAIQAGLDGKIQLNLFDPDQTRIEYMEFTPAMKPCCSDFTAKHPAATDPD